MINENALKIATEPFGHTIYLTDVRDIIEAYESAKERDVYTKDGWFLHKDYLSGLAKQSFMRFLLLTQGGAESIDIHVRKDGVEYDFQADFLKHIHLADANRLTGAERAAIDKALIAGNHLASVLLGWDFDPEDYPDYDTVLHGRGADFASVWLAWKATMNLRDVMADTGKGATPTFNAEEGASPVSAAN